MRHRFAEAKEAFVDEINVDEYIELEGSRLAYAQLEHSLEKSTKMVLLYGKPGTGKTLLLSRLYRNYHHQKDLHFFETPTGSRKEFYARLFEVFTSKPLPPKTQVAFETLVAFGKEIKNKRKIIILVDEAQMYPRELLEEIRILSDTGSIKFVISLHKTSDEDLVAKAHFQSRIWESVELRNANQDELKAYIHKRLLFKGLSEEANSFRPRQFSRIYRWTEGNFRECNKLLYTLFELCEYYDQHAPHKMEYTKIPNKLLEMAAIKTGMIHV